MPTVNVPAPEAASSPSATAERRPYVPLLGTFEGTFEAVELRTGRNGWTAVVVKATDLTTPSGDDTATVDGVEVPLKGRSITQSFGVAHDLNPRVAEIGYEQLAVFAQTLGYGVNDDGTVTLPDDPTELLTGLQAYNGTRIRFHARNSVRMKNGEPSYKVDRETGENLMDENGEPVPWVDEVFTVKTRDGRRMIWAVS